LEEALDFLTHLLHARARLQFFAGHWLPGMFRAQLRKELAQICRYKAARILALE
jgi:hypothetical protein